MNASRFARRVRLAALASGLAISVAAGSALAQPGPMGHGHHGPGAGAGGDVAGVLLRLKSQLNLDTSQQQMWDNAVAQSRQARDAARTEMDRVRAAMQAELAKATPDLRAVAAVGDDVQAKLATTRKAVRDQWLTVYDNLSAEQKAVVKSALAQRFERMEQWRQRMGRGSGG